MNCVSDNDASRKIILSLGGVFEKNIECEEYYLIDVRYSPTFVTVNYNYYNINNSTTYGDVTNVYYFELTDGRNSSSLSADEVAGLDLGYDVVNYELVPSHPCTPARPQQPQKKRRRMSVRTFG